MFLLLRKLNPFSNQTIDLIKTPWGTIEPKVDIYPLIYLLVIYGFIYILPFGRDFIGMSWFDWCRKEDGPLEWIQFTAFTSSFLLSINILWKQREKKFTRQWLAWLLVAMLCFFIAGEEISWGERITGVGIDAIKMINKQGETNLHNLPFIHHKLLDPAFEFSCLFLGWFGWRLWPNLDALPSKKYSLYFLFVALFFFYFDISYSSTIKQIRNDQEIFELLMAIGLCSHCWEKVTRRRRHTMTLNNNKEHEKNNVE